MESNGACLSDFLEIQKNICFEICKVDEKIVPAFHHISKFLYLSTPHLNTERKKNPDIISIASHTLKKKKKESQYFI